jgi:hypothetical protein
MPVRILDPQLRQAWKWSQLEVTNAIHLQLEFRQEGECVEGIADGFRDPSGITRLDIPPAKTHVSICDAPAKWGPTQQFERSALRKSRSQGGWGAHYSTDTTLVRHLRPSAPCSLAEYE